MLKKCLAGIILGALLCGSCNAVETLSAEAISLEAPSALLMEQETGTVIYAKNAHEQMAPASVTKVMTLLLVMEAMESGQISETDIVTGSARAASMGGSQIWLEEGEKMTVRDMLKSVAVASANDCAVALAEHLAGSEEAFVRQMNDRAAELGAENTHFTNCTGLFDDPDHYTSAYDIAVMSRALLDCPGILDYTGIWMDTVRDGAFGLSSTNKLLRSYTGATGLKTGYTALAGHCISATARRDGVTYIAVILHGATSQQRFEDARTLLNYGFANYTTAEVIPKEAVKPVRVQMGTCTSLQPVCAAGGKILVEKTRSGEIEYTVSLPETISAPVEAGMKVGTVTALCGGEEIAVTDLVAPERIERLSLWALMRLLLAGAAGAAL